MCNNLKILFELKKKGRDSLENMKKQKLKMKKKKKQWSETDMARAMRMVIQFKESCRGAAKTYNVLRSTLFMRLRKVKHLLPLMNFEQKKEGNGTM
jgi:transposase-like protein